MKKQVKSVAKPFRIMMDSNDITLDIIQDESTKRILNYDQKLYEECLFNIMQNSVKFNKKEGQIRVTQDYNPATGQLKTTVYDTGFGVTDARQKTLLTTFKEF